MVENGACFVPGLLSFPQGETKKSAAKLKWLIPKKRRENAKCFILLLI
jgi:hypothetical protein